MIGAASLNTSGGRNRLRFRSLRDRIQEVDIDVMHRVRSDGYLDVSLNKAPETGASGCFFQDELERCKELETTSSFKRFYYSIWPLVQSLPELLHHLPDILDKIFNEVQTCPTAVLPTHFQLISVLARDLGESLFEHMDKILGSLVSLIDRVAFTDGAVNPELTGKLFECISYLFKFQIKQAVSHVDMFRKFYGALLGSSYEFVRDLSAKAFSLVYRKVPARRMKIHLKAVVRAIASNVKEQIDTDSPETVRSLEDEMYCRKRLDHIVQGFSLLLYYTIRGVKDSLHTCTEDVLGALFTVMESFLVVEIDDGADTQGSVLKLYVVGRIASGVIRNIVYYIHPKNSLLVWTLVLNSAKNILQKSPNFILKNKLFLFFIVEYLSYMISDSKSRFLEGGVVKQKVAEDLIVTICKICDTYFDNSNEEISSHYLQRSRILFCHACKVFHADPRFLEKVVNVYEKILGQQSKIVDTLSVIVAVLFESSPIEFLGKYIVKPTMKALSQYAEDIQADEELWLSLLLDIVYSLIDCREELERWEASGNGKVENAVSGDITGGNTIRCTQCKTIMAAQKARKDSYKGRPLKYSFVCEKCRNTDTKKSPEQATFTTTAFKVFISCNPELQSLLEKCINQLEMKETNSSNAYRRCLLSVRFIEWTQKCLPKLLNVDFGKRISNVLNNAVEQCKICRPDEFPEFSFKIVSEKAVSALTCFSSYFDNQSSTSTAVLRFLLLAFIEKARSISLLWSITRILKIMEPKLFVGLLESGSLDTSKFYECICSCVASPSHWLRYMALRIVHHLPHPEIGVVKETLEPITVDIMGWLIHAVLTPISLETEREFTRIMEKIEVVLRGGKLPIALADICRACCLGILRVKFQPFWEPSIKVILADSENAANNNSFWSILLNLIETFFSNPHTTITSDPLEYSSMSSFKFLLSLKNMSNRDDGEQILETECIQSVAFYFRVPNSLESLNDTIVHSDSRADGETVFRNLWSIVKRCPSITLKRSKIVVPLFLKFLSEQYYVTLANDPEVTELCRVGVLPQTHAEKSNLSYNWPIPVLKKRLEMFLNVFSAVTSPRQLHRHTSLYAFYTIIMSRPDLSLAKLAFDCILTYKPTSILPYKDNIKRLLVDSSIREEMLVFVVKTGEDSCIDASTRSEIIPLLVYTIYGRLNSKLKGNGRKGKEQSAARKNAVLQFLSVLPPEELRWFIYLMVRGLFSSNMNKRLLEVFFRVMKKSSVAVETDATENFIARSSVWFDIVENEILSMSFENMEHIVWEKQISFLHLMENMIKIIGFNMSPYIKHISTLILCMISYAHTWRCSNSAAKDIHDVPDTTVDVDMDDTAENLEELKEDDYDGINKRILNQTSKVRTLGLLRISEMINQYHEVFDFSAIIESLFETVASLVIALPESIAGSTRPSALLELIHTLTSFPQTTYLIASKSYLVEVIISCVAYRAVPVTSKMILTILTTLLNYSNGSVVIPHSKLIIESFTKRFIDTKSNIDLNSDLKISDLQISPTGPLKLELNLLCLIAEKIFDVALVNIDQQTVFTLATLLLGMIKSYTSSKKVRIEEDWIINIFRTYRTLLPNLTDVTGHVPFVSRLFGPTQESHSLFNTQSVRHILLSIYIELSHHKSIIPKLDNCRVVLSDLMAMDPAAIDSRDFAKTMPMLRSLSGDESLSSLNWSSVLGPLVCSNRFERSLCTAVVYELIRCMYDGELALRTSALLCLKRLVDDIICWITETSDLEWADILDSVVLPSMRHAIQKSQDSIKKGFLFLLSHIIQTIGSSIPVEKQFQSFHGDLVFLLDEDPEKDFFENITHIQLHRRVRALRKLGDVLSNNDQTLSTFSLSHVLLPIAMHQLLSDDFQKKDQQILSQGTIPFLSILSRKLPWSQYFGVLRVILKNLEKNESKEKLLLLALSEVLGSFHFELNAAPITEISDSVIDIEYDESKHSAVLISDNLVTATTPDQESSDKIAGIVLNKLYPWVHAFLLKDTTDHNNNASKVVRTPIVVALTNLIRKLEPPFIPEEKRVGLLSNLAMNIVNTLKSRDTGARDTARESLAKMIKACGMSYLHLIFRELIHSLNEGYQRHVRNYSIRFILNELLGDYSPEVSASSFPALPSPIFQTSPFDACIPMIMHCVMDDINGESLEDRSVEGVQRNLIREAKGNKAVDILETCARCLLFRPSYVMKRIEENDSNVNELKSSIHELTSPLLSVLVECEDGTIIGRIGEGLQRVAQGLSKNPSVTSEELLLYTYSTLNPFVKSLNENQQKKIDAEGRVNVELSKSTDEDIRLELPSYFYEEDSSDDELFVGAPRASEQKSKKGNTVDGFKANTWLPSTKGILTTRKSILEERDRENKALSAVCDGASAPRLSGFDRNISKKKKNALDGPEINAATVAAVKYCLTLLSACLRQDRLDLSDPQIVSMTTPFLPLLYRCICLSNVPPIVVLALKVISLFLSEKLPVEKEFSRVLGTVIVKLMFSSGALVTIENEVVQSCIKCMTCLFQSHSKQRIAGEAIDNKLPFPMQSIRSLVEILLSSVSEISASPNSTAFPLIRAIVEAKVLIPEIYDLLEKLIEQTVLSHRKTVRESASSTIVNYILTYPLGNKRLASHIKQFIKNCSYEYEEGRLSALNLLETTVKLLPSTVLSDHAQSVFMAMSLRVVNDPAQICREKASEIITALARRVEGELFKILLDYSITWLSAVSNESLSILSVEVAARVRTGSQIASILVIARPELAKKFSIASSCVQTARQHLVAIISSTSETLKDDDVVVESELVGASNPSASHTGSEAGGTETWAVVYHLILFLENLLISLTSSAETAIMKTSSSKGPELMCVIQEALLYPHSWVRIAACRFLSLYLSKRNPLELVGRKRDSNIFDILLSENGLYNLTRRLCVAINQPSLPQQYLDFAIPSIVFLIRAMAHNNELCGKEDASDEDEDGEQEATADQGEKKRKERASSFSGARWPMQRLTVIGTDMRGQRRLFVHEIFSALAKEESSEFLSTFLKKMLKVALSVKYTATGPDDEFLKLLHEKAEALMRILESKVGSSAFIDAIGSVHQQLTGKKLEKKAVSAQLAVSDPVAYAVNKRKKYEKKTESKKRKGSVHLAIKGLTGKKTRSSNNFQRENLDL